MSKLFIFSLMSMALISPQSYAKLNVVTSISDLRFIAGEVGGEHVTVESIAKGTQDPHFIEAKPSFMIKMSRADLLVVVGLGLETGWIPSLVQGSRNPKIKPGTRGYLEVGPLVQPIEVRTDKVSRAEGDVHPEGNPHVTLDPKRAGDIALALAKRLGELDPAHTATFMQNAKSLQTRLDNKTRDWQERINKSGQKKIVSYHKTLTYFFLRFNIENPAILEPKPGLPPTSGHILGVIDLMRREKISLILVENYFDPTVTKKIEQQLPSVRTRTIPVSVDGSPTTKTLDDLYEEIVTAIENKG